MGITASLDPNTWGPSTPVMRSLAASMCEGDPATGLEESAVRVPHLHIGGNVASGTMISNVASEPSDSALPVGLADVVSEELSRHVGALQKNLEDSLKTQLRVELRHLEKSASPLSASRGDGCVARACQAAASSERSAKPVPFAREPITASALVSSCSRSQTSEPLPVVASVLPSSGPRFQTSESSLRPASPSLRQVPAASGVVLGPVPTRVWSPTPAAVPCRQSSSQSLSSPTQSVRQISHSITSNSLRPQRTQLIGPFPRTTYAYIEMPT